MIALKSPSLSRLSASLLIGPQSRHSGEFGTISLAAAYDLV
jgi:hypothetical protein